MNSDAALVPGRECGDCTICCSALNIDKPQVQKASGVLCRHCSGGGCAIYQSRFEVCREFHCAWRQLPNMDEGWRPDRSGVFAEFQLLDGVTGLNLMLVGNPLKIVRQKWFQDFIVTGVMSSVPLFLSLPGPRGHQAATVSLNTEQMVEAIGRGAVKDALEAVVKILRGWDFQPAVITYSGNDVSSPEQA